MRAELANAVIFRAGGVCECGCGQLFGALEATREIDHIWGRARAPESFETLWVLRRDCHRKKSYSKPSRVVWLGLILIHMERSGYDTAKAKRELEWALSKQAKKAVAS